MRLTASAIQAVVVLALTLCVSLLAVPASAHRGAPMASAVPVAGSLVGSDAGSRAGAAAVVTGAELVGAIALASIGTCATAVHSVMVSFHTRSVAFTLPRAIA